MIKMLPQVKKIFFTLTFNSSLFLILMIGIQNSSEKSKVNILFNETVSLPISFIVGISFITGNLAGSLIKTNFHDKNV